MKKFVSIALVIVMILALGTASAFAAAQQEPYEDLTITGLSKTLQVAQGITGYPTDYTFTFTAIGGYENAPVGDHAAIGPVTITVGAQTNDEATGYKAFSAFLPAATAFPHAGYYVYNVVESAPAATDNLTVDGSKYKVTLLVKNGTAGLEYAGVIVEKYISETETEKVDPTIITNENGNKVSGFNFTNKYVEFVDDVTVTKEIEGAYADMSKTFDITVKLYLPSTADPATDVVVDNGTYDPETQTVTATLGDGDVLSFTKLPAGSKIVKLTETQLPGYSGEVTGLVTGSADVGVNVEAGPSAVIVNDKADHSVTITNTRDDLIPTGVIIDNLPYVLLVLVAVAGVAYITLKKKAYNA